jgi:glycosyltransferase involved in cell wall biosynthesis
MKVGIPIAGFMDWGGGIDFLRIILKGFNAIQKENNLELIVLIPEFQKLSLVNQFKLGLKKLINQITFSNKFTTSIPVYDVKQIQLNLSKEAKLDFLFYSVGTNGLNKICLINEIEVLIPSFFNLKSDFSIPWVGYIADFQHKYYPEFFSSKENRIRDKIFNQYLNQASAIIVNSKAVKNDAEKFFNNHQTTVFSLPFCPLYPADFKRNEVDITKFNLPENYFLISNQFWKHKDHATAFKGFAEFIKTSKIDVHLVCTGSMSDYRFPDYINYLKRLIAELGIENKLHLLGYILKEEQKEILLKSKALIQPTLFEGGPGGGAVYEALANGIPALMSDIPVNCEIQNPLAYFFKVGDEKDLASKMNGILHVKKVLPESLIEFQYRETKALGNEILKAINHVLKHD